MKILHCITGLHVGGAEMMLYRFLRALGPEASRHAVFSLMPPGKVSEAIAALDIDVIHAGVRKGSPTFSGLRTIRRTIADISPDIIHGWMYHGNFAASIGNMLRRPGAHVIWSVHHSLHDIAAEPPGTRLLIRISAPLSRTVAAISYCSRVSAKQHELFNFDKSKELIIPNGIDTQEFRPRPGAKERLARMCGFPSSRLVIGNVARFHPMKDQVSLIRATAALVARGYDIHTVVVGPGKKGGNLYSTVRELDMDGRVTIMEMRADVAEIVPGFDLFVLSSAWGEAFPLSAAEALSSGVPAVVTDVGDCSWLVGNCGVVVEPKKLDLLAEGIERVIRLPPDEREQLGCQGRARIKEHFSIEKFVSTYQSLYQSVAARNLAAE